MNGSGFAGLTGKTVVESSLVSQALRESALLFLDQAQSRSGLPPAVQEFLAERLGEVFSVRLLENLDGDRVLLEVGGDRVVAEGKLPVDLAETFRVRLQSLEPVVRFSLAETETAELPTSLRRGLGALFTADRRFSGSLMQLETLMNDPDITLPPALRNHLGIIRSLFSAEALVDGLKEGKGFPLAELGLAHEAELAGLVATLENHNVGEEAGGGWSGNNGKEIIIRLLAGLSAYGADDAAGREITKNLDPEIASRLQTQLKSLREMVELNQLLNNPGINHDRGLFLVLPLWGWGTVGDLWLRLAGDGGKGGQREKDIYSLMVYLDFEELGAVGARIFAGVRELQVDIMVASETSARVLRELLPEVRGRLRSRFSGGSRLAVTVVGDQGLEEFRHRAFLASLPPLLRTSV